MTTREPVPFEELLAPLVSDATRQLRRLSGPAIALFAPSAIADLKSDLLRLLSGLAAPSLQLHWRTRRTTYTDYTRHGLREPLTEYTALGRLLHVAATRWANANATLIKRLDRDYRLLGLAVRVVRTRPSLSDRRQGGHTVAILEFEDGHRVVYKPRSMHTERAFQTILEWCSAAYGTPICPATKVTVRRGYGWQQFIPQLPCDNEGAVRGYFDRAGALLCILYVLKATDCHMGNLIASGEYPVLVDAETLFQSLPQASVLSTGLLPEPGEEYNISGLGIGHRPETEFRVPVWQQVNTDTMTLRYARAGIRPHRNLPILDSQTVDPARYLNEVVSGFETMYRELAARRSELLQLVQGLWRHPVRHMAHSTRHYFAALNESLQPRFLRDEGQRRQQIFRTIESFGMDAADGESLLALDIPHSYAAPDRSGVRATILSMSEADLERQRSLIRISWTAAVLAKAEHLSQRAKTATTHIS